ncbi:MAG: S8 family serine peptidase [Phycisphaerales bacterium]
MLRGHQGRHVVSGVGMLVVVGLAASLAHAQNNEWYTKSRINDLHARTTLRGGADAAMGLPAIELGQMEDGAPRWTHEVFTGRPHLTRPGTAANDRHATGVAGVMAGNHVANGNNYKGVAPGARLQSTDIRGGAPYNQGFKDALDWLLLAPRANIINVSWGRDWDDPDTETDGLALLGDWAMARHGVLMVAAAGNEGSEADRVGFEHARGRITSPGKGYNVLTVGGTARGAGANLAARYQTVWSDSSYGPAHYADGAGGFNYVDKPDVVAPATIVGLATNTNDTAYRDTNGGTSFAAPQVAGTAAILHDYGRHNALSTDQRVMRAVIMNGANKSVQDRNNVRWDKNPNLGQGLHSVSNDTGTGMFDAAESFDQYAAGSHGPTFVGATYTGNEVPLVGWNLNTVTGEGPSNSNDYRTQKELCKGSYVTATLAWNRQVNDTNADFNNWTYRDLNDLDLGFSRFGAIDTIIARSNSAANAREHLNVKVPEQDKYYLRVWDHALRTGSDETYALAWKSYAAPDRVKEFNGDFSGDRGALCDNGWFTPAGSTGADVLVPTFAPAESGNFAMALDASGGASSMAQELLKPDSFFEISFDYAFTSLGNSGIEVWLGDVNLLTYDAQMGDSLMPDLDLLNSFARYSFRFEDAEIFDQIGQFGFTDLTFKIASSSPGLSYIDNVTYIPTPGSLALLGLAGLLTGRRVRRS